MDDWMVRRTGTADGRALRLLPSAPFLSRAGFLLKEHLPAQADLAGWIDVDLHTVPLDDAADHLAARPDDIADLVHGDADRDDARREDRDVLPRRRERFAHLVEDVEAAAARLFERLVHHLGGDAADLDVH